MSMKRFWPIALLIAFVLGMFAAGTYLKNTEEKERTAIPVKAELTIYTDLPSNLTTLLAQQYEMQYHVRLTMLPITEEQMATRMTLPASDQKGDLVITTRDNLDIGVKYNQLKPVLTEGVDKISDRFKNNDALWVGIWYDPVVFAQSDAFYNRMGAM